MDIRKFLLNVNCLLCIMLIVTACSPMDLVKAVLPKSESKPLLNVETQVGDKGVAVGQTQQIKENSGYAIGHDQYSGAAVTVNNSDPLGRSIVIGLCWALGGFLIGWPISGTPQSFIKNWIERRKNVNRKRLGLG